MSLWRKLSGKPPKPAKSNAFESTIYSPAAGTGASIAAIEDHPPAYTVQPIPTPAFTNSGSTSLADSPFSFLSQFDTILLIDDSGSMSGSRWHETEDCIRQIAPIITQFDSDGIDIHFLNSRNPSCPSGAYTNITSASAVSDIFRSVRPKSATPTGIRLNDILKPYLAELATSLETQKKGNGSTGTSLTSTTKPLNIIVITDGAATDDPGTIIVSAAKKLDQMDAVPWQVGIQFFQVGNDTAATRELEELDDIIAGENGVRDMVDTMPYKGRNLSADDIMKATMGAINRKLDRKKVSPREMPRPLI